MTETTSPRRHRLYALAVMASVCFLLSTHHAGGQESPHGKIKVSCTTCHSTDSWAMKKDASFSHASTGFELSGKHASLDCKSCHADLQFASLSANCLSCHTDVHKSELGNNCVRCHTTGTWKLTDMIQRHQNTRFPLLGRHATLDCQSCHANASQQSFAGTPLDCFSCHRSSFLAAKAPDHVSSGFPTDCMKCHDLTAVSWGTGFDHSRTSFPLSGAHIAASCFNCHKNQVFKSTSTQCISCHEPQFAATTNPNHRAAGFSLDCQTCHTTSAWQGARFDHGQTGFPLRGAHQAQQCLSCHRDNVFSGKPTDCVACHRADFDRTTNPNHVAGNFPTNCQTCHSEGGWRPATFNHAVTRFPLTGAHQAVSCNQCHINNQYTNTPSNCIDCHRGNYNATTNPNHQAGNFSTNCTQCHTTTAWRPASFDHAATSFPLTGRHSGLQCQACHTNNNYGLVYQDCYQCHQADFGRPQNPNHVAGNFNHDCSPCHTTAAWRPSTFDHATTRFPLTGRHAGRNCNDCHLNSVYAGLPSTCWDCHEADYRQATDPNHVQRNFSRDCTQCHSTNGWEGAAFDHNTTNFPLTGRHATAQCQVCHVNGNYQLVYTDCYVCHQTEFAQPQNPNHVAGNFNHDCAPCHTTSAWRPSTFSHNSTSFPLTGAHQATSCNQCHVNNQYQGLPSTCVSCHLTNYNGATNPNHRSGNFSQNCSDCHTTGAWRPASFDHNASNFPLTGRHITVDCQSCHTNNNYNLVYQNCYQCHSVQFAQPQNPNHVTLQFSHDCTPCHTTSAWRPSTFNHDAQYFRIYSGKHRNEWTSCQQCHPTPGQYQIFTCTTACHPRAEMDDEHRGINGYQYSSPRCLECHRNV